MTPPPRPPSGDSPERARRFSWVILAVALSSMWGCSDDSPSSPPPPPNTPPASTSAVEISSPPRADMLLAGSFVDSLIAVSGVACDSMSTVTSMSINGQAVPLTGTPPCLDFTAQVNSRWGLNTLSGVARNQAGASDFHRAVVPEEPRVLLRHSKANLRSRRRGHRTRAEWCLRPSQSTAGRRLRSRGRRRHCDAH